MIKKVYIEAEYDDSNHGQFEVYHRNFLGKKEKLNLVAVKCLDYINPAKKPEPKYPIENLNGFEALDMLIKNDKLELTWDKCQVWYDIDDAKKHPYLYAIMFEKYWKVREKGSNLQNAVCECANYAMSLSSERQTISPSDNFVTILSKYIKD